MHSVIARPLELILNRESVFNCFPYLYSKRRGESQISFRTPSVHLSLHTYIYISLSIYPSLSPPLTVNHSPHEWPPTRVEEPRIDIERGLVQMQASIDVSLPTKILAHE